MDIISIKDKKFVKYIHETDILKQIERVSSILNTKFSNKCPLLLCVLKGSYMFYSDFTKKLKVVFKAFAVPFALNVTL